MELLNGKELANKLYDECTGYIKNLKDKGETIRLAVVQVGEDTASDVYIRNKRRACERVGISFTHYRVSETIEEKELLELIDTLNEDKYIHGILVQLPLPKHISKDKVSNHISPIKDVDGFHEHNMGKLILGKSTYMPCTTLGIMMLLEEHGIKVEGKHCVVVGRSDIVGKPTALALLHDNGTVTICHSKTSNLKEICKTADILVCAIGKPKFFNKEYIKDGAIVIDVGIHRREDGGLCGDVDFEDVKDIVSAITPVPGGVGAMTVASLITNCLLAYNYQGGLTPWGLE